MPVWGALGMVCGVEPAFGLAPLSGGFRLSVKGGWSCGPVSVAMGRLAPVRVAVSWVAEPAFGVCAT